MKVATRGALAIAVLLVPCTLLCENVKTYKHASEYQIAILDQNVRVATGTDATLAKNTTDSKLGPVGQGIHLLHTDAGDYRVEAPINKGASILSAMASNAYHPATTFHNKWFLDNVQPGTKVLFASECARPNKKHPNDTVRCTFYFPDPDSSNHEYATIGDFTPFSAGDGSNTAKTAGTLCGTGKLKPQIEAQLCLPQAVGTAPPIVPATAPHTVAATAPLPVAATPAPVAKPVPPSGTANVLPPVSPASNALVMATVVVESNVKSADIEVDGQFLGSTPSTITLTPGQHTIVVKKKAYQDWKRTMNVTGGSVHVNADMVKPAFTVIGAEQ